MLSMKNEIEKIWDDVLVKLEQEHDVSSAAINAWIKPLHIKDVQSNKIILSLDAKYDERGIQFIKKKMYDFYISLAISDLTGKTISSSNLKKTEKNHKKLLLLHLNMIIIT